MPEPRRRCLELMDNNGAAAVCVREGGTTGEDDKVISERRSRDKGKEVNNAKHNATL